MTDFADQIDHPGLRDFYGYWLSKRGGKQVPARADIDPVEIHRFLPNIFMLDVIDGGARFRYRLVGTAIGDAVGDYSGRFVDEALPPEQYDTYRQKYAGIIGAFELRYETARIIWREQPPVIFRRLMLPLSDDQVSANILLGVGYYESRVRMRREGQRIDQVVRIEPVSEVTGRAPPPTA